MITGKKDELDDIAKNYVCKEDGGYLSVCWDGKLNAHVLHCQHDHIPEEVTRQPTLTEMYKQGQKLPEPVESNIKKGIEKRAARLPQAPKAVTMGGIPTTDLGTGELLTKDTIIALCEYAWTYKLDPARGHVCLMHGKPYITIDGYLYHAHQTGKIFTLASRPLAKEEFSLFQIKEGSHAWMSTVTFAGSGNYVTGLGIVTPEELTDKSKRHPDQLASPVVAAHPWQMAQKRAEWQALRRAFPIGETKEGEAEKP